MIIDPEKNLGYKETLEGVKALSREYGEALTLKKSGKSQQSREIPLVTLGRGKRKILAVSSVHGREWVSTSYLLKCLEDYAEAIKNNRLYAGFCVREIFEEFTLYSVPMANPDGVEMAQGRENLPKGYPGEHFLYKGNARGVNLNANFPYLHRKVPKSRCGGQLPASERETRFLMKLCNDNDFEGVFSFHTRGNTVYWRDLGNGEIPGDEALAVALRRECGFDLEKPTAQAEDYSAGFENWFRYKFRRPGFCVELVKDENRDFSLPFNDFSQALCFEKTRKALLVAIRNLSQA